MKGKRRLNRPEAELAGGSPEGLRTFVVVYAIRRSGRGCTQHAPIPGCFLVSVCPSRVMEQLDASFTDLKWFAENLVVPHAEELAQMARCHGGQLKASILAVPLTDLLGGQVVKLVEPDRRATVARDADALPRRANRRRARIAASAAEGAE